MTSKIIIGILIPFLGTTLGSAFVFFMKRDFHFMIRRALTGFASGVMTSAAVWSLILPALDFADNMGKLKFIPASVGFMIGIAFLLLIDKVVPHLHFESTHAEGLKSSFKKTTMLLLAVTIHNIPEGMAVGVVYAGFMSNNTALSLSGAFALSLGIAIQNIPEGAIISMPLRSEGIKRWTSFLYGTLSGIVEPIGAFATVLAVSSILPLMPYILSFAAGAMIYVVVEELIPEMSGEPHTNIGTIMFSLGFIIMMILDTTLS